MDVSAALLWTALTLIGSQRPRIAESITVTSHASPIATPAAVTTLGSGELRAAPALTLDDTLRSVPGFSLFRRSSSRVSNPTTQGATLRGLAASGASRALVLLDSAPLNDPFGGWVYWSRVPAAAVQEVAIARGASGDEHGGDALAGVVAIRTGMTSGARLFADAGSHSTGRISAFGAADAGRAVVTGALDGFTTGGYVMVAPESRGPVDEAAASRHATAYAALRVPSVPMVLTASHFRESRRNGTPLQRNSTRVTHVAPAFSGFAGRNAGWSVNAHASTQQYEQTFSAVFAGRAAERLTSRQLVGASGFGAQGEYWWHDPGRAPQFSAQVHAKRVAADLLDTPFGSSGTALEPSAVDASQVSVGGSARISYRLTAATAGAAVRVERWRSGSSSDVVLVPRLWIIAAPSPAVSVTAAFRSGFRAPTINELYRPFRVGSVVTNANAALQPERARGVEAGVVWHGTRFTARALAFWSRVQDAIVNVTLSAHPELILRQRQNAATIRAAGGEFEVEARVAAFLTLTGTSTYTDSLFTAGPLDGLDVPQVPRWQHGIGGRFGLGRLRASAEWRYIGSQFDDDRNLFALDRSTMTDARIGWALTARAEVFGAIENLFDEEQDVGRTPLRTLGLPRATRVGVRVAF